MDAISSRHSHPTSVNLSGGNGVSVKTKDVRSFSDWVHSLEKIVSSKKMGEYWVSYRSPWRLARVLTTGQPTTTPLLDNHFTPLTLERIWYVTKMRIDYTPKQEASLGWLLGRVGVQEQLKHESSLLNRFCAIFERIQNFCLHRRFQTGGEMIQTYARDAMCLDKISFKERMLLQLETGYSPEGNVTRKWKGNYHWKNLRNVPQPMLNELRHLRDIRYHDTASRKLDRLTATWLLTGVSASHAAELAARNS